MTEQQPPTRAVGGGACSHVPPCWHHTHTHVFLLHKHSMFEHDVLRMARPNRVHGMCSLCWRAAVKAR